MEKKNSELLTVAQKAELDVLAAMPEDQINTANTPEQREWSGARRGLFFRPKKKQLTLRLDADFAAFDRIMSRKGGELPRPEDTP